MKNNSKKKTKEICDVYYHGKLHSTLYHDDINEASNNAIIYKFEEICLSIVVHDVTNDDDSNNNAK